MIRVIYHPDGSITQAPQGYGGQLCHEATKPYAEIHGGRIATTDTAEAQMEPVTPAPAAEREQLRG